MKLAFAQYSSNFGGSTVSGELIVKEMVRRDWSVDVYFGFDGPFVQSMKGPLCNTHVIPHKNWLRHPGLVRFTRNLRAETHASKAYETAFRENRPDIVCVNSIVGYAAALAAARLKIPLLWYIRELFADEHGEMAWPHPWAKGWVRRRIRRLAQHFVANSESVATNVFGPQRHPNLDVVYNAVLPAFFEPRKAPDECRQRLKLPTRIPLVGLPGTLRPVKGHRFFCEAVPHILKHHPECHFAISGAIDSPFAKSLVEEVREKPFADRVHFIGNVAEMTDFYHACTVCCVPSLSEPFGRTAIECFATQTPLVVSAVGGLREIVRHNENGLSVPYGDASALAESVNQLIRNPNQAQTLVATAWEDAKTHYTAAAYQGRIAEILTQTLTASQPSATHL